MECTSSELWNDLVQLEEYLSSTLDNVHHISHIIFRYLALPVYPDERLRAYKLVKNFRSLKKWDSISMDAHGKKLRLEQTPTMQLLMADNFQVTKFHRTLGSVLDYLEIFIPNMRTLEISEFTSNERFIPYIYVGANLHLLKDSYLTRLRLDGCIRSNIIPKTIMTIQSLRHLCLKACQIILIPEAFRNLKNLQSLDISRNKIMNLDNLKGMTSLTSLNVSFNCLSNEYENLELFDHLPSLKIFEGFQFPQQHLYCHGKRSQQVHKSLQKADFRGFLNSFSPNLLHTFPNLEKLTMNVLHGSILLARRKADLNPNHPLKELVYHNMEALGSNVVLPNLRNISLKKFR